MTLIYQSVGLSRNNMEKINVVEENAQMNVESYKNKYKIQNIGIQSK